jgi:hypothetical protein
MVNGLIIPTCINTPAHTESSASTPAGGEEHAVCGDGTGAPAVRAATTWRGGHQWGSGRGVRRVRHLGILQPGPGRTAGGGAPGPRRAEGEGAGGCGQGCGARIPADEHTGLVQDPGQRVPRPPGRRLGARRRGGAAARAGVAAPGLVAVGARGRGRRRQDAQGPRCRLDADRRVPGLTTAAIAYARLLAALRRGLAFHWDYLDC